jgi:hypothetical protein
MDGAVLLLIEFRPLHSLLKNFRHRFARLFFPAALAFSDCLKGRCDSLFHCQKVRQPIAGQNI